MYKIIGGDQKEYGPVTADQLREWIQAGRADARTRVQQEGRTDWQTLSELPEFSDLLAVPPRTGAAALPARAPQTSGMAIASLVCGILGMCGVTALVGLGLGIISLRKINRSQGQLGGQGLAIAGIAVSAFMLLFSIPFLAGLTLPALAKAKTKAQSIQCMNNVKQLTLAAIIYANDHDGRLPDANKWCDLLQAKLPSSNTLLCPAGKPSDRCDYGYNTQLGGAELNRVSAPSQTVLFVESEAGWNRSGGAEMLVQRRRHGQAVVVGFVDGHVEVVTGSRLGDLRWSP